MCQSKREPGVQAAYSNVDVLEENVLENSLTAQSADYVISSFGLKTFSKEQLSLLAKEISRILKPGGHFSFIEISVPSNAILRWFYGFYLNYCIPVIGKLFLGNPDNYRMLWRYTQAFGDCRDTASVLQNAGLHVEYRELFFGCASGLYMGYKPEVGVLLKQLTYNPAFMDIAELTQAMHALVESKGWYAEDSPKQQSPKNLALSLSIEAAEVLEHVQWSEEIEDKDEFASELADVALYLLQLASISDIDLEAAILHKLEVNYGREWDN